MKAQRSTEIKVGLVTVSAIILFILGITLGRGYHESISSQTISLRFPNSGGIQPTAPIVVNGVRRGSVINAVNDNGSVLVTASIDGISDLKSDATAKITILELTGGKKIEIYPGKSNMPFNTRNEIPGTTPPDLAEMVTILGDVSGVAVSLINRLDSMVASANTIISDPTFIRNVQNTVDNASQLTASMNTLVKENFSDLEKSIKNLKIITEDIKIAIKNNEPRVENLISELEQTLKTTQGLLVKADTAITNANGVITDVKDITNSVKNGNGFVSRIIYDKNFNAKIDSTLNLLNDFILKVHKYGINTNVSIGRRP